MDPIVDTLLFIIAIALSILTAFSIVIFYYFLKIMGDVQAIAKSIRATSEEVTHDIEHISEGFSTGERKIKSVISFFNYFLPKKKRKKAGKKS